MRRGGIRGGIRLGGDNRVRDEMGGLYTKSGKTYADQAMARQRDVEQMFAQLDSDIMDARNALARALQLSTEYNVQFLGQTSSMLNAEEDEPFYVGLVTRESDSGAAIANGLRELGATDRLVDAWIRFNSAVVLYFRENDRAKHLDVMLSVSRALSDALRGEKQILVLTMSSDCLFTMQRLAGNIGATQTYIAPVLQPSG